MPREYFWYETKYVTVPDVRGLSLKEAKTLLTGFNLEYTGSGETVVITNPEPGKRVKEGSLVKLMLN